MITKKNHAMPCPTEEICYLCGQKMFMTSIGYGGEKTRIDWKCKCGSLTSTISGKECKMATTEAIEKKLCMKCKHYINILMNCKKAPRGKSLVDGKMRYEPAAVQREYPSWWIWRCGKKGRFWESTEDTVSKKIEDRIGKRIDSMKKERGLK